MIEPTPAGGEEPVNDDTPARGEPLPPLPARDELTEAALDALGGILCACQKGRYESAVKYGRLISPALRNTDIELLLISIMDAARRRIDADGFVEHLIQMFHDSPTHARMLGRVITCDVTDVTVQGYCKRLLDKYRESEKNRIQADVNERLIAGVPVDYEAVARQLHELDALGVVDENDHIMDAGALLARDCQVSWLVDGLIPRDELTVVSGIGASGKTFLCSWLCIAVSRGVCWLGRHTEQCAALYIDCENSTNHAAHRYKTLGLRHDDLVHVLCSEAVGRIDVLTPEGFNCIRDAAQRTNAGVVVIDTLRRITSADLNDAAQVDRTLNLLRQAAMGRTLVVLHHWRKSQAGGENLAGERLMGSVDLRNFARAHLVLETQRVDDVVTSTLTVEKSNFAEGALPRITYTWQRDAEGVLRFIPDADGKPRLSALAQAVVKLLQDAGGSLPRHEIVSECAAKGVGERDVQRALGQLVDYGIAKKTTIRVNGKAGVSYELR